MPSSTSCICETDKTLCNKRLNYFLGNDARSIWVNKCDISLGRPKGTATGKSKLAIFAIWPIWASLQLFSGAKLKTLRGEENLKEMICGVSRLWICNGASWAALFRGLWNSLFLSLWALWTISAKPQPWRPCFRSTRKKFCPRCDFLVWPTKASVRWNFGPAWICFGRFQTHQSQRSHGQCDTMLMLTLSLCCFAWRNHPRAHPWIEGIGPRSLLVSPSAESLNWNSCFWKLIDKKEIESYFEFSIFRISSNFRLQKSLLRHSAVILPVCSGRLAAQSEWAVSQAVSATDCEIFSKYKNDLQRSHGQVRGKSTLIWWGIAVNFGVKIVFTVFALVFCFHMFISARLLKADWWTYNLPNPEPPEMTWLVPYQLGALTHHGRFSWRNHSWREFKLYLQKPNPSTIQKETQADNRGMTTPTHLISLWASQAWKF